LISGTTELCAKQLFCVRQYKWQGKAATGNGETDRPPSGSKDPSDAIVGAVCQLSRIPAWQLVDKVAGARYAAAIANPRIGGTVTPINKPQIGAMAMIRALRKMPQWI